jgi:hypothetical protein
MNSRRSVQLTEYVNYPETVGPAHGSGVAMPALLSYGRI